MLEDFKIPIQGLEDGIHEFKFEVGDTFIEDMGLDENFGGLVDVVVELDKLNRTYSLNFNINGNLIFPCDRCLDDVEISISDKRKIYVKVVSEIDHKDENDEIIWLEEDAYELDISKILYEFIVLSLPMKRVHQDDEDGYPTCNPEILDKIEKLNSQKGHDPRWDELNKLKK